MSGETLHPPRARTHSMLIMEKSGAKGREMVVKVGQKGRKLEQERRWVGGGW